MKLSHIFLIGSISLFAVGLAEAKEEHAPQFEKPRFNQNDRSARNPSPERHEMRHDRREDRHEMRHDRREDRHEWRDDRRDDRRDHRHERRESRHDDRHHRRELRHDHRREVYRSHGHRSHVISRNHNADYFLGGLVIGSIVGHSFHDHHYTSIHNHRHYGDEYFWQNRFGECFEVQSRPRGDVYIEVPRFYCR